LARIVNVELEKDVSVKAAVYAAVCPTGRCYIVAYIYSSKPRLAIVPAQPSPFCTRIADQREAKLIMEALRLAHGVTMAYGLPLCVISSRLLKETIKETINHLRSLGLIEKVY